MSTEAGAVNNREEILADFQSCTGIEDIAEAILHLEQCDWDLVTAINHALPQHTQTLPSEREVFVDAPDIVMSDLPPPPPPKHKSTSSSTSNTNNFHVKEQHTEKSSSEPELLHNNEKAKSSQSTSTDKQPSSSKPAVNRKIGVVDITETSDDSDVEDFTESFPLEDDFVVPERKPSQRYLITENIEDEETGTILFAENFAERYGHCHPFFFHGTLENAIREATNRPAKDRRMLAVYLHHEGSVFSNVFCQQALCSESIVNYLTLNFVVWGWDVTNEGNRQMLIGSVTKALGTNAVGVVRSFDKDRYPVILLISRRGSSTEVCNVIQGSISVDDLMVNLLHALEMYRAQQGLDIREEEEREARERVIQEQNAAYQESLKADIAKDEAKRALEVQKQFEELERQEKRAREVEEREKLKSELPAEPGNECTEPVCSLKVRVPDGKFLARKFLQSTTLKTLYDYLYAEGYSKTQFKYLLTYPKRDLNETHPETQTLGNVFSAQDTLIVEQR